MWLGLPSNRSVSGFTLLEWMIAVPISSITGVLTATMRRRDHCMSLPSTDGELFRLGSAHQAAMSLSESAGLDDAIRASSDGVFGLALNV
jgi:hypothetical protein